MADSGAYHASTLDWAGLRSLAQRAARETPLPPAPRLCYVKRATGSGQRTIVPLLGPHWVLDIRSQDSEESYGTRTEADHTDDIYALLPDGSLVYVQVVEEIWTFSSGEAPVYKDRHVMRGMSETDVQAFDFAKETYGGRPDDSVRGDTIWGGHGRGSLLHDAKGAGMSRVLENVRAGNQTALPRPLAKYTESVPGQSGPPGEPRRPAKRRPGGESGSPWLQNPSRLVGFGAIALATIAAVALLVGRTPAFGASRWDWLSLDVVYYPVSAVLWFWYRVFGTVFGPASFAAWALAVALLAFTLRLLLHWPFVRQIRTSRQLRELQPQIKALRRDFANDRQRMALEMQKLQRKHGFNPIMMGVPTVLRALLFVAVLHVLLSFNRTTHWWFNAPQLSMHANRATANYVFSAGDVANFLDARLFGAPLGALMAQSSGLEAFGQYSRTAAIVVGAVLLTLAVLTNYLIWHSTIARQGGLAALDPQTAGADKFARYVLPAGTFAVGLWLPLALIVYLIAQNVWTFGEQHYVFGALAREDAAQREARLRSRGRNRPLPRTRRR